MPSIVNYCYKICIDYKCGEYEYKWNESVAYNYNRLNYYNNDKCEFEYKFIDDFIISSKLNKDEVVNYIKFGLMSIFWTQKVKLFYAALLANNSH